MKKLIICLLVSCGLIAVVSVEKTADASSHQGTNNSPGIIYGGYCCDALGYRRCVLDGFYPIGNLCWCYGQGSGWVCL